MQLAAVVDAIAQHADPARAAVQQRFFQTQPGGYAEGDVFVGVPSPVLRAVAKDFAASYIRRRALVEGRTLAEALAVLDALLADGIHERRMVALMALVLVAKVFPAEALAFYLRHTAAVNNWDLVDVSCVAVVGEAVRTGDRALLDRLARSESLWERRIAVVSTLALVRAGESADALRLCEALLGDRHHLIHKACGWVLREVGKRDAAALRGFLRAHAAAMPGVMFSYATERLGAAEKAALKALRRRR